MNNKLIVMSGLPRSGKSTIAKKLGYPIVNPNAVRLALYAQPYIFSAERMIWTMAYYMVESLFLAGHNTVILDATNLTRKRREEWISDSWIRVFYIVKTSKDICIERAKNGNRYDLVSVIEKMHESYEPITEEEFMSEEEFYND